MVMLVMQKNLSMLIFRSQMPVMALKRIGFGIFTPTDMPRNGTETNENEVTHASCLFSP
jgi:hypothetical protein